jgi:competence protein ComEA
LLIFRGYIIPCMPEWWKNILRDYFTFTSGQRNGIFILCLLLFISISSPFIFSILKNNSPSDFTEFKAEIDSLEKFSKPTDSFSNESLALEELNNEKKGQVSQITDVRLFPFDPNTATADDFKALGLRNGLIKIIINYRNKGGKFLMKDDFKKIYGLKKEEFDRLSSYINIPTAGKKKDDKPATYLASAGFHDVTSVINLNAADSLQLVSLPGIGGVLSSRIIKFRKRLGGFYSVDQLRDVYGISPETFESIRKKIFADPNGINKMNLNNVTIDDMKLHPYFKSIAGIIISYRDQHGTFKSLDELKNIEVISPEVYEKIAPYLTL